MTIMRDDLISRQAAIDAADKVIERDKSGNNAVVNAMIAWSEYIRALPSAQPETNCSEIPNNSDAVSRQAAIDIVVFECGKWTGLAKEISKQLKQLPSAQPEPQWIPVSERLPRDGSWNIFTDGKNISVERYKADAIDHFFPAGRWFELEDVIAWMPLPEAYKPNK